MTLHWWMHWFWVTMLLITFANSGMAIAVSQTVEVEEISTDAEVDPLRHAERQSRAMYFSKTPQATTKPALANKTETNQTDKNQTKTDQNQTKTDTETKHNVTVANTTEIVHPSVIQWTAVNATELTITNKTTNMTTIINTTLPTYTNLTNVHNSTFARKKNITRIQMREETSVEGLTESRIVTEKPLSLETAFLNTRIPPNVESSRRVIDNESGMQMDTGAIAGISFAALVLAALAGSTAFVLYRRRYLNKPQTLNDKCSNPDSSGYLDDSTVRDNSEEMYSLDNDSFLNSLEAMTIQNYWTDTVKHTKL